MTNAEVALELGMTPPATIRIEVEQPVISGDTVLFRWTQSEPNPYQRANAFSIRYEGIDLTRFSPLLFFEIFLGLQLKVFAAYKRPVELILPAPVPETSARFWQAFHNAELVSIAPIADVTSYSPWRSAPETGPSARNAVFFGGGRDSMATTCLLAELDGPESVVLIQSIAPLNPDPKLAARLERRQEKLMLKPARERLGVATQRFWTDYQALFHRRGEAQRPHLELYTLGALPALLAWGVSLATFCMEWSAYPLFLEHHGGVSFGYPGSRPEVLATQTKHYRRVLGAEIAVTDLNLLFTSPTAFRILVERYPAAIEHIVMCTHGEIDERWCYQCSKCAWYPIYGLSLGFVDPTFDYERLFGTSRYVQRIVEYAESGVELSPLGNAPLQPFMGLSRNGVFCHVVAKANPELIAGRIRAEAYANLMTIIALFGNRTCPAVEMIPTKAVDLLDHETARRAARLVGRHAVAVDDLPGPFLDPGFTYDFGVRMPTRTERLDHIRD